MKSSFHCRLAFVLALLLAPMSAVSAQTSAPDQQQGAGVERKVLVMLKMTPPHFRAGSGYGGSYGDGEGRSARWRAALRLAHDQGVAIVDEWPMPLLGVDCFVMIVPVDQSTQDAATRLARDPSVSWSEPMHGYRGQAGPPTHNDPLYRLQPAAREWRLAELHQVSTGRNVRVAVIDSMIDQAQPDLIGQIEMSENFMPDRSAAPEDHGTGVAGIIAARADDGIGIAGVAPEVRLMALRACWQESGDAQHGSATFCDTLGLAKALEFAINHKAQVINMSLAGPNDQLLSRLLDVAIADDITVVAAYDRNLPNGGFPASHKGAVAVLDEGTGPPVNGVYEAPGRDVPTTQPGGRWFFVNGSSYAAAHVSGLFALLRQRSAQPRGASALLVTYPGGGINACATLLQRRDACNCGCVGPHQVLATVAR